MTFLHEFPIPIIHRDLKPSNVLISASDTIKIADFGLAKYVPHKNSAQPVTSYVLTGGTGSYRYMAPEVYRHEPYETSVDVYSYALNIYWLYTGLKPYGAVSDAIKAAHLAAHENLRPSLSPLSKSNDRVGALLARCWHKTPDERPRMSEVCQFFEAAKEDANDGSLFGTLRAVRKSLTATLAAAAVLSPNAAAMASPSSTMAASPAGEENESPAATADGEMPKRKRSVFGL